MKSGEEPEDRDRHETGVAERASPVILLPRDSEQTNIPFYISDSDHLCRPFNHKILDVALLRLRFCSIRNDKSGPNLNVKPGISASSESLKTYPWRTHDHRICIR